MPINLQSNTQTRPFLNVPFVELSDPNEVDRNGTQFLRNMRQLSIGAGDEVFRVGREGVWAGHSKFADAPFRLTMDGNAVLRGTIQANAGVIGGWVIAENQLSSDEIVLDSEDNEIRVGAITLDGDNDEITGGTIVGTTFKTAETGERIEINTTNYNQIGFFNNTTKYGYLAVDSNDSGGALSMRLTEGPGNAGFDIYNGIVDGEADKIASMSSGTRSFQTSFNEIIMSWDSTNYVAIRDGSDLTVSGLDIIPSYSNQRIGSADDPWSIGYINSILSTYARVDGHLDLYGNLNLRETGSGSHVIQLRAPVSISSNFALLLPGDAGSSDQVLTTDGVGNLSWEDPSSEPEWDDIGGSMIPGSSSYDIGSSSSPWDRLYVDDIYLSSTDGSIYFGSTLALEFTATAIQVDTNMTHGLIPETSGTIPLGATNRRWSYVLSVNGDFSNDVDIDGDLDVGGDITVDGDIDPDDDGIHDLGSASDHWDWLYVNRVKFDTRSSNPTTNGQMVYYNSGNTHEMRVRIGGSNYRFVLEAV